MSGSGADVMLRIMPREMRMMTERIFSLTSLPKGFFLAAQDVVMYSQKLGLGGFALLEQRWESFRDADLSRIRFAAESNAILRLDAGGQHAWFVVPSIIDLLGETAQNRGSAHITIANAGDPEELQIAACLASRSGLSANFTGGDEPHLTAEIRPLSDNVAVDDPLLWQLLQQGARIEPGLWWRIYHLAQKALTPDSIVSRRHAGPLIVKDDGTIIGRKDNDDETDITFLTSPKAGSNERQETES